MGWWSWVNSQLRWQCGVVSLVAWFPVSDVLAGPIGGQVVGGAGSISQTGTQTTISQTSQNMAINWQSYNLNANDRVQYLQPNSSSISLNRILSNNGSVIAGRIDANGHVILVNPNGVFFTPTSVLNVGGIIASGLDIKPNDFMNGNYIFNEVIGTDGGVINQGIINASLGGNVALMGRHVQNNGFISANLGTVNLAAGKEAVLTFDAQGLLGVRVTKEILQSELGVDPAVLNSGTINAEGGKVLLTASVSQDVFSQAVNTNGIQPATSVVVNADGSFTLGGGADVVNTGTIDTSTTMSNENVGRIVLLGNNVTSSGTLKADAANGNGGEIELHAKNTALLTQQSMTTARSASNGNGGVIKVLGNKVGLFDQSTVDVSGVNGGGQALIGGDAHGSNPFIPNAQRVYVSGQSQLIADALHTGNGGKIIVWGDETTWFYGNALARGGDGVGNGGFVEVSAPTLSFVGSVDTTAVHGQTGTLLLDPTNIDILAGSTTASNTLTDANATILSNTPNPGGSSTLTLNQTNMESLASTTNISLAATNNITIEAMNNGVLALKTGTGKTVNFTADADNNGSGNFVMVSLTDTLQTQGAKVNITAASIRAGNILTTGSAGNAGGSILLNSTNGGITVGALTTNGGANIGGNGFAAGLISLTTGNNGGVADSITINGNLTANGSDAAAGFTGGNAGNITLTSGKSSSSSLPDRVTLNGNLSAQGGAGTTVGLNNAIVIDTPLLVTQGDHTISTAQSGANGTGDITVYNTNSGSIYLNQLQLGGSLSVIAGSASNNSVNWYTNVDYQNVGTNGATLTLQAGKDITVWGNIANLGNSNALINVSLLANTNADTMGDANLASSGANPNLSLATGGGNFTVSGVNYVGAATNNNQLVSVDTGSGNAFFTMSGTTQLGTMNIGGTLSVTSTGAISEGSTGNTPDILRVTGTSSLISMTGTISLSNANQFTGAVSLQTSGTNDLDLTNQIATILGNVSLGSGKLTVNANTDLTVSGTLTATGASTVTLNFGNNGNASTFTVDGAMSTGNAGQITVNGGNGNNTFVINTLFTGTVNGANGYDTIIGPTLGTTTDWQLQSYQSNSGTSGTITNGKKVNFTAMNTVRGGGGVDTFTFAANSNLDGYLDGGGATTGLSDSVDVSALGAVTVKLLARASTGNYTTPTNILSFYRAGSVSANATSSNLLIGDNVSNTWNITDKDQGNLNDGTNTTAFLHFGNLQGGTLDDHYIYKYTSPTVYGALSGVIDGGGNTIPNPTATQSDDVDFSALTKKLRVQLCASVTCTAASGSDVLLRQIQAVNGNASATAVTELVGDAVSNTWTVDGFNQGHVNYSGQSTAFTNVNSLTGGKAADTFNVQGNATTNTFGQLTGTLTDLGGSADVRVEVSLLSLLGSTGQLSIVGGSGTNTLTFTGNGSGINAVYTPNLAVTGVFGSTRFDQFTYSTGVSTLSVNVRNIAKPTNGTYALRDITTGLANFTITNPVNAGSVTLTGTGITNDTTFNVSGAVNGSAVELVGTPHITVSNSATPNSVLLTGLTVNIGKIDLTGNTLILDNANVQQGGGDTLTAGTLVLRNTGDTGSANAPLVVSLTNLSVENSGITYLSQSGNVNLVNNQTTALLDITTPGSITSTAPNQFGAALALNARDVQLAVTGALTFGNLTTGNLTVSATGDITNTGTMNVTGPMQFTTPGAVTLNSGGTNLLLGNVSANAITLSTGNAGVSPTAGTISSNANTTLQGGSVTLTAFNGVNVTTQTPQLTITNVQGAINVTNTGAAKVQLTTLGDITLMNHGDLFLSENSLNANGTQGYVITGPSTGNVYLFTDVPSTIHGSNHLNNTGGGSPPLPDINAYDLYVGTLPNGQAIPGLPRQVGAPSEYVLLNVYRTLAVRSQASNAYLNFYGKGRPLIQDLAGITLNTQSSTVDANSTLIVIEPLSAVDPAIFTHVNNYWMEDVAILLPDDQDISDDDEEKKKRRKRVVEKSEKMEDSSNSTKNDKP